MHATALLLAPILIACGSSPAPTEVAVPAAEPIPEVCTPALQALDFASIVAADDTKPLAEEDVDMVEKLVLGLMLGSDVNYAHWGPTGDLLVALSGCEEGECSAGVALIERNNDGFFVKKKDTSLPSVLDGDVDLDHVFIANRIGDESPEFWVVYSTFGQEDESERNVAVYTLSGLTLLWSATLGPATEEACLATVHTSDLACDGLGDIVLRRSCENAPIEEAHYEWQDGKLRAPATHTQR
tara:strand:- start:220 stop:942 length:723 start_codon:yes stop_codon:yes gene_type:complete